MIFEPHWLLVAIGVSEYDSLPRDAQRPEVASTVTQVVDCLMSVGYRRKLLEASDSPTKSLLLDSLDGLLKDTRRSPRDVLALYYCAHGVSRANNHYLLTRDSQLDRLALTALRTEELAHYLIEEGTRADQILIILDACWSGTGAFDLSSAVQQLLKQSTAQGALPQHIFILASAATTQEATPGAFSTAFSEVLANSHGQFGGPAVRYLEPSTIACAVQRLLKVNGAKQRLEGTVVGIPDEWRLFPNPIFDPTAQELEDLEAEADPHRARSAPEHIHGQNIYDRRDFERATV
jgi:hypothetical protein